jgi:hypothetical protein
VRRTLRLALVSLAVVLAIGGIYSVVSRWQRPELFLGTWRFEQKQAVQEARSFYATLKRSPEWRSEVEAALRGAEQHNLLAFEIAMRPENVATFRYLKEGEPTLPGRWREDSQGQIELHFDASPSVSSPRTLWVRWVGDRLVMSLVSGVEVPFRQVEDRGP